MEVFVRALVSGPVVEYNRFRTKIIRKGPLLINRSNTSLTPVVWLVDKGRQTYAITSIWGKGPCRVTTTDAKEVNGNGRNRRRSDPNRKSEVWTSKLIVEGERLIDKSKVSHSRTNRKGSTDFPKESKVDTTVVEKRSPGSREPR